MCFGDYIGNKNSDQNTLGDDRQEREMEAVSLLNREMSLTTQPLNLSVKKNSSCLQWNSNWQVAELCKCMRNVSGFYRKFDVREGNWKWQTYGLLWNQNFLVIIDLGIKTNHIFHSILCGVYSCYVNFSNACIRFLPIVPELLFFFQTFQFPITKFINLIRTYIALYSEAKSRVPKQIFFSHLFLVLLEVRIDLFNL